VRERPDPELGAFGRAGATLMIAAMRALFRIRVDGIEHVPRDGSAIVAANHVSALDGVVLGLVLWQRRRRVTRFLTASEFFRKPLFGRVLRAYRQIPLERGSGDVAALDAAIDAIANGGLGGIFPEGLVNADPDGPLQRGRTGVARIALAAGAPVVPVGIAGTQERWPRSGPRWSRPLRPVVALSFGEPIALRGDRDVPEDAQRETAGVMNAIAARVVTARSLRERRT
jgi:1-acyl-sn-glycerol-3-phosphate acyltransferase